MKRSRQLSILALCATAALGFGMSACDDDAGTSTKSKAGQSCAENGCEAGLVCNADKKCEVPEDPKDEKAKLGEDCSAEKACEDGLECGDEGKCVEKNAPVDEKAKLGEDCGSEKACADGLVCGDEGKCVEINVGPGPKEDPCEGVTCPDGKMCLNARCLDPECIDGDQEKSCDNGKMCSKGECVDDGCQDKTCGEGEVCSKGICEDALCLEKAIVCNDGATCVKGACVDNECLSMTCDGGLTCSKGECVYPACLGKEACDPGKICNEAGECVFEKAPALSAVADTTETDENGGAATISLSLNNPPSKEVTVTCALSPEEVAAEAEVSCEGVLFDAQNYGDVQTIHVVGLPDNKIDPDFNYSLTITTVSEDELFNGLTQKIDMVNKNVDTQGVSVYVNGEMLTTTESGGSAVFTVVLKAKPEADVTFEVSSSNPEYGVIDGAQDNKVVVTFTPENWDQPQEIKVVGVDDDEQKNESAHNYEIVFSKTSSEDANYQDLEIASIAAVNLDNDIAEAFLDKTEIVTEEGGAPVDIMLRLGLAPAEDVQVQVSVLEADGKTPSDEVKLLSDQKFTITKDNYKEGVAISLQGVDDHFIDGDQDYKVRVKFITFDEQYGNLDDKWITGKNIDMNVAALTKEYTETTVSEDGTSLSIDLSLSSIPTADVTVALASSDKTEMSVKPASMTFTPENWDQPQKITVTGLDDVVIDGDIISDLTLKVTSEDKNFGGDGAEIAAIDDKIEIKTLDNDVAAIVVVAEGAEVLENSGKTLEFKVMLSAEPEHPVTVTAKSNDESELKIVGQPTLIFNEENWKTAQTVFLQVQDDGYADGTQTVHIDLSSVSEDAHFDGLKAQSPDYNILDNESATITLTLGKTTLVPGDYTTSVSVALSAPPLSDVVVTLSSSNAATAALSNNKLTFTTANWDQAQSVTLTDANPQQAKSAKSVETISAVAAGEGQYNGLKAKDAQVTLYAFKEKSFAYTGDLQEIALLPGKYKLEVYGSQGTAGWPEGYVGKGGYSTGTYQLAAAKTLYVCVGGNAYHAATDSGGYNGGGFGHGKTGPARGGGATHIAIAKRGNGTLRAYEAYKSDVLIVAGGAGGMEWSGTGGAGGGASGAAGTSVKSSSYNVAAVATPGTQSAGGTSVPMPGMASTMTNGGFGYGGYGYTHSGTDYGAGGGGGWYGGGGTSYAGAAAGGSGYIGGVTSGSMSTGVNANVGSAKITLLD